ncbi:RAMP superfamily CRISPR-associated protein [Acrocarpospora catenulata]|uniref:RAMP superfamily CRISPR-associated protein n=1 Tax=Acrocarpospora catenulata TaxID=2836182 RepID=UPI001BDADC01|nr:RAMP superfamily CRISPR-associated protein [Acrocarpospora catenulata]
MNIELNLLMLSDWRIGTGTGIRGYADRLVQRDAAREPTAPDAPIVPAKTLIGVWRDSCEVVAHALDAGPSGAWHDWLEFLFGGQYRAGEEPVRPAALALDGPLRLPQRLTDLLRGQPRVAWAATFRKPGVAIDPVTGTAETEKLRFEEMARAGVTLTGNASLRGFDEMEPAQQEVALAFLTAGARLLERIGGKRRRGAGRCRLELRAVVPDFAVLVQRPIPVPPGGSPYAVEDRPTPVTAAGGRGWERVELVFTVQEPVLAGAVVQGNLTQGQGHLPGWCLMPEVARRLGGPAHALVRTGDLVVTAATPLSPGKARTSPVPRVLVHKKNDKKAVIGNRMAGDQAEGKPYRDGYVVVDGEELGAVVAPAFTLRMHNTVGDGEQRPTQEVGGVYTYKALAAGTMLRAEVRVRTGALPPDWEKGLCGTWRIGRSAKDDYGRVRVEARPVVPAVAAGQRTPGLLRVWLLSDLLVRDRRLRPSTDPADVARALAQALTRAGAPHLRLTQVVGNPDDVAATVTAMGTGRTESWHRGWGLPRPTLYGLAAGTCLTFTVEGGQVTAEVLDELRAAGIGERRAEGFGQIEIDHELLFRSFEGRTPTLADSQDRDAARVEPLAPGERGHTEGRIFERAAWRAEVHRVCELIMADPVRRGRFLPEEVTSSQLNGLRDVVREPSMDLARNRLTWLTKSNAGRRSWPEEKVALLFRLLEDPDEVWTQFSLNEDELTVTLDGAAILRTELHDEAVRVLITACVAAQVRHTATRTGDVETARTPVPAEGRTR